MARITAKKTLWMISGTMKNNSPTPSLYLEGSNKEKCKGIVHSNVKKARRMAHGIGKYRQKLLRTPTAGNFKIAVTPQTHPQTKRIRHGINTCSKTFIIPLMMAG